MEDLDVFTALNHLVLSERISLSFKKINMLFTD